MNTVIREALEDIIVNGEIICNKGKQYVTSSLNELDDGTVYITVFTKMWFNCSPDKFKYIKQSVREEGEVIKSSDMNIIKNLFAEASSYGLEVEVITWALLSMKRHPNESVVQAMIDGYNEWIK